jgi:hypothetical protein
MRSGPKAILYQSTLFRTSELVWVKVAPLAPWRELIRWSLVAGGLAFYMVVASAKGSYFNLEGFLGLLAWHVGYHLQPDVRLASTGDLQESYESRGGSGSAKTFRQWVAALSEGEDECKLQGKHYQHWFNLQRIAWAGPCWIAEWYPLILIPVFLFYRYVITLTLPLDNEILSDIHFLTFQQSPDFIHFLCYLMAVLGFLGWATSVQPGVVVRACGGLTDKIGLSGSDRSLFLERLAGNLVSSTAPSGPSAGRGGSVPAPRPSQEDPVPAKAPPPNATAAPELIPVAAAPPKVDLSE